MKKNPDTYEIDSFEKLINVINRKNFECLTVDLLKWLMYVVTVNDDLRKKFPKMCKGKSNWDLCKVTFIWIDDGKHDMKSVVLKNELTGEVKTFELKHGK